MLSNLIKITFLTLIIMETNCSELRSLQVRILIDLFECFNSQVGNRLHINKKLNILLLFVIIECNLQNMFSIVNSSQKYENLTEIINIVYISQKYKLASKLFR